MYVCMYVHIYNTCVYMYIYSSEQPSAVKTETLPFATMWMAVMGIMLSELSKTEK